MPAEVVTDRGVLLGVGAVVGAVEGEVAQGGELGFDPVQPRAVGRQEHQLDVVGLAPGPDGGVFVRREVVQNQMQRLAGPAAAQAFEEVEELARARSRTGLPCGFQALPGRGCRFSGPNSSTQMTRPPAGGWS